LIDKIEAQKFIEDRDKRLEDSIELLSCVKGATRFDQPVGQEFTCRIMRWQVG